MRKTITAAIAAITLVGGLAVAAEASAQHRYRRDNNDAAAAAIAGFALGAVVGGNGRVVVGHPGYGYYGGRGYYDRGYGRHYDRRYYDRRAYNSYHRPYYGRRCWTERVWDPYYGRVNRRVCR